VLYVRTKPCSKAKCCPTIAVAVLALTMLFGTTAAGQDLASIKKVDASTPRGIQIKMAEAAAPKEITSAATMLVLGKKGYEVVREGSNGFTCLIQRQTPETMEPECFDREGSKTTLEKVKFVEVQRSKGIDEKEISRQVEAGYTTGKFKAPSKPGIVYMLSPYNRVLSPATNTITEFPGHLMFYAPYLTKNDIGHGDGAPYLTAPGKPTNLMVVVPR
jgi:hypothetical protein